MKICQFSTLAQGHLHIDFKHTIFKKQMGHFQPSLFVSFKVRGMKIYLYGAGQMTQMAAKSMYSKIPLNSSSQEQGGRFPRYEAFGNLSDYSLFKI